MWSDETASVSISVQHGHALWRRGRERRREHVGATTCCSTPCSSLVWDSPRSRVRFMSAVAFVVTVPFLYGFVRRCWGSAGRRRRNRGRHNQPDGDLQGPRGARLHARPSPGGGGGVVAHFGSRAALKDPRHRVGHCRGACLLQPAPVTTVRRCAVRVTGHAAPEGPPRADSRDRGSCGGRPGSAARLDGPAPGHGSDRLDRPHEHGIGEGFPLRAHRALVPHVAALADAGRRRDGHRADSSRGLRRRGGLPRALAPCPAAELGGVPARGRARDLVVGVASPVGLPDRGGARLRGARSHRGHFGRRVGRRRRWRAQSRR